jgi:methylenetetrahydrofolate dehydrogenase (NADP+) / methenyltetrahydrofolate cyclohydrolase
MLETTMMVAAPLASQVKQSVSIETEKLKKEFGIQPKLVALLIGTDPVSRTYVELKKKDCAEVGILSDVIDLSSEEYSGSDVIGTIKELNDDKSVHAVIPQMPFNGKVSEEKLFSTLSPYKDADGMTPFNLGKLERSEYELVDSLLPCTPKGVVLLCKFYSVPIEGQDVVIIGRSTLVGEPLRKLLQDLNATVTCCHTKTRDVQDRLKNANVVVAASGRPPEMFGSNGFRLTPEMVKEGSTVISVGVRKDPSSGKMLFDVDIPSLKGKSLYLTPNTGGVGVMTRACLLQNTIVAARRLATSA